MFIRRVIFSDTSAIDVGWGRMCFFFIFEGVDTQTPFFVLLLLSSSILPLCGREGSDWIGTNQIEYYIDLRNMNVHSCLL